MATTDIIIRPEEFLESMKNASENFTIERDEKKHAKGRTTYLPRNFKSKRDGRPVINKGLFLISLPKNGNDDQFIPITAIKSPEEHAKLEADRGKTLQRLQLKIATSKCGDFGKAIELLNPEYVRQIEEICKLLPHYKIDKKEIKELAQMKIADSHKDPEKRGQPIEDPMIDIRIMLGKTNDGKDNKFPDKHPLVTARGKYTVIKDYDTKYTDDKGIVQFKDALVEVNGEMVPVDDTNVHLFITHGSLLYRGRCYIDTPVISAAYVSMPKKFTQCIIKRGGSACDDDDVERDEAYVPADDASVASDKPVDLNVEIDANAVVDVLDDM